MYRICVLCYAHEHTITLANTQTHTRFGVHNQMCVSTLRTNKNTHVHSQHISIGRWSGWALKAPRQNQSSEMNLYARYTSIAKSHSITCACVLRYLYMLYRPPLQYTSGGNSSVATQFLCSRIYSHRFQHEMSHLGWFVYFLYFSATCPPSNNVQTQHNMRSQLHWFRERTILCHILHCFSLLKCM